MKIRPRHQDVAYVRCLEGGDIGLFLGDQKAAKGRKVGSNGGLIDGLRMAGIDKLLGLTGEGDDIVSDDADAYIMKLIVGKGCNVSLLLRERVAFVATSLGIEQLPAAFCRIVNGIPITRNEMSNGESNENCVRS